MSDYAADHAYVNPSLNGTRKAGQQHQHLGADEDDISALEKIRTAGSISISPELFEKIYLSPQNKVKGDIRQTFGNPTPIALGGFLLSLCPLTNDLLGWRGSGGLGAAETGIYFFFGGLLMVLGGVLEFVLGNTFPSVVFSMFGAFWLGFAATLVPYYNAAIAYDPNDPTAAAGNPEFLASFAFFLVYMGVLCLIFLVCSLRTNLVFVLIFACLVPAFGTLAASFWHLSRGNTDLALTLQHVGAGLAYAVCCLGWYLFAVQLLAAVDFPLSLPVVDLSQVIKGASEMKRKNVEPKQDVDGAAIATSADNGERNRGWRRILPC